MALPSLSMQCSPRSAARRTVPAIGQRRHGGLHAGMDHERVIPAGPGQKLEHMPLRRGQHHIAAGAPIPISEV